MEHYDSRPQEPLRTKDMFNAETRKHIVRQQITGDFVLELWEKSTHASGDEKKALENAARLCSKKIGSWLVE